MRAIDLYAGIGGWSLGLRLAGVEVVASYEWWQPAVDTHNGNHDGDLKPIDVRHLQMEDLPSNIDLVVGSPPCTEFSYSNRGGRGDLDEGLKDLVRFLEVVEYLKPKFWALENVPRVAHVLERGMSDKEHPLYRFRNLGMRIEIIDFSEYGTPQSRRRCIAGNIPFDLIKAYRPHLPRRTLGDVVSAITAEGVIVDPVWGCALPTEKVTERENESRLNAEELRMNREAKTYHPVYNNMAFPDVMDLPARTITATCTRVSRESIVIGNNDDGFRRLSIRERACLQGFPITYQFYARSFPEKAKMVGNAIPPTFTYLIARAVQDISAEELVPYALAGLSLRKPEVAAPVTLPTSAGRIYPEGRSFRAALQGLRFKSGMRFELANGRGQEQEWRVRFFFGPSIDVREVTLDGDLLSELRKSPLIRSIVMALGVEFANVEQALQATTPGDLQAAWSHRSSGLRPFQIADLLSELADVVHQRLLSLATDDQHAVIGYVMEAAAKGEKRDNIPGSKKLTTYALPVLSGLLVGAWFNTLQWHRLHKAAA